MYQQVELEHRVDNDVRVKMAWIPEYLAIPGLKIKFKEDDGSWSLVWEVVGLGNRIVSQKDAEIMYKLRVPEKYSHFSNLYK